MNGNLTDAVQTLSKSIERMQNDQKKIVEQELLIAFKKCEEAAVIKNIATIHKAQICAE